MKSKTILRVINVNNALGIANVLIPQWSSHKIISIPLFKNAEPGYEFDVIINLSAKDESELQPEFDQE